MQQADRTRQMRNSWLVVEVGMACQDEHRWTAGINVVALLGMLDGRVETLLAKVGVGASCSPDESGREVRWHVGNGIDKRRVFHFTLGCGVVGRYEILIGTNTVRFFHCMIDVATLASMTQTWVSTTSWQTVSPRIRCKC